MCTVVLSGDFSTSYLSNVNCGIARNVLLFYSFFYGIKWNTKACVQLLTLDRENVSFFKLAGWSSFRW